MNKYDHRRNNLLLLLADEKNRRNRAKGWQSDWANAVGISADFLSQLKSDKKETKMGSETARKIENYYERPMGWMDQFRHDLKEVSTPHTVGGRYIKDIAATDDHGKVRQSEHLYVEYLTEQWADSKGRDLDNMLSHTVVLGNLEPVINKNDVVTVDISDTTKDPSSIVTGAYYLFGNVSSGYFIQKVFLLANNNILLQSINKTELPDQELTSKEVGQIECIGRVVRMSRDLA